MWDIHFETWTDTAVAQGLNHRQTHVPTAQHHVTDGLAGGFRLVLRSAPAG